MPLELHLPVQTGIPPLRKEKHPYYGDRYSDVVWLASGNAACWDFQNDGWVAPGLHDGPSPVDYDYLPKNADAKKVQWVLLPRTRGKSLLFASVVDQGQKVVGPGKAKKS